MSNEKLCEYLSDIGLLLFENIDLFFQIHSSQNNKQFKNEPEKLKESLFLYLQQTTKNDNLLRLMSNQLIESYYNSQVVTKYKNIKNLINILKGKLSLNFNSFIINLSRYIITKNKTIISFNPNKDNKFNSKRTNSDDNILRKIPHESPIKKTEKPVKQKTKPKKRTQKSKKMNQFKNNYYRNIQNVNINPHSFFINNDYNNLNMYNNNFYNNTNIENTIVSNNNNDMNDENIVSYKYYSPLVNFPANKPFNNFYTQNNSNQILMNDNNIFNNQINNQTYNNNYQEFPTQINAVRYNNNNISYDLPDDYDFFYNEQKHVQKVQNKIMNLKNEKMTKLEEQCTFTPKINPDYKFLKKKYNTNTNTNTDINNSQPINNIYQKADNNNSFLNKYQNKNTFEKLYNDSSVNKIKKEERIKKYLEEFKFTPNIEGNEKYPIKSSFEERRKKSIDARANYKKQKLEEEERKRRGLSNKKRGKVDEKETINRLYVKEFDKIKEKRDNEKKLKEKEERKKHVIDWKKVYKTYNEKYPEGDDYKRHLEKRRKFMENKSHTITNERNKNNVMDFQDFLKEKEQNNNNINNISNNNDIEKDQIFSDNNNNDEDDKEEEKKEEKKEITPGEVQDAINEAYKSNSLKNLLNENNLFKNDV